MLILAVLYTWVKAAGRALINEHTPRTGRHRGTGRANRAAYRGRRSREGAHTGSLYGVTYVLTQTTRGVRATGWATAPTAAYPIVIPG